MLVLSRYAQESILIGEHIQVKVIKIDGDRVSIGIEAPREIPVHREEVAKRIAEGEPVRRAVGDH